MRTWYILAILCFTACGRKSLPEIPERARTIKQERMPDLSSITPDTALGHRIYQGRCQRCHDLPLPSTYSRQKWDTILQTMIPRARLNEVQALHLRKWIEEAN